MANIKIDLDHPLIDGETITFKAPCDCTAVTGMIVYYPNDEGNATETKSFTFKDSHNNDLTGIGNLFSANAIVAVTVNTATGAAHLINADTNTYLENRITSHRHDGVYANAKISVVNVTASTTLALTHAEKTIRVNSANAVTLTVPTNASVTFPVGTCIIVTGVGAGTVTFTPASGVTINSKKGALSINGQYAAVTLYKSDTNVWELWGALA